MCRKVSLTLLSILVVAAGCGSGQRPIKRASSTIQTGIEATSTTIESGLSLPQQGNTVVGSATMVTYEVTGYLQYVSSNQATLALPLAFGRPDVQQSFPGDGVYGGTLSMGVPSSLSILSLDIGQCVRFQVSELIEPQSTTDVTLQSLTLIESLGAQDFQSCFKFPAVTKWSLEFDNGKFLAPLVVDPAIPSTETASTSNYRCVATDNEDSSLRYAIGIDRDCARDGTCIAESSESFLPLPEAAINACSTIYGPPTTETIFLVDLTDSLERRRACIPLVTSPSFPSEFKFESCLDRNSLGCNQANFCEVANFRPVTLQGGREAIQCIYKLPNSTAPAADRYLPHLCINDQFSDGILDCNENASSYRANILYYCRALNLN